MFRHWKIKVKGTWFRVLIRSDIFWFKKPKKDTPRLLNAKHLLFDSCHLNLEQVNDYSLWYSHLPFGKVILAFPSFFVITMREVFHSISG